MSGACLGRKLRPPAAPRIPLRLEAAQAEVGSIEPALARRLADAFWPGPVTVIVRRRAGVATAAAGGHDSIGLRCPAHPVARALLAAAAARGVPGVAAPSANRFGRVSPTCAAHVADEFGADLLVLDTPDWRDLVYHAGSPLVHAVWHAGERVA